MAEPRRPARRRRSSRRCRRRSPRRRSSRSSWRWRRAAPPAASWRRCCVAVLTAVALAPLVRDAVARDSALDRRRDRGDRRSPARSAFTAWMLSDEVAAFSRRLPSIVRDVRDRDAVGVASPEPDPPAAAGRHRARKDRRPRRSRPMPRRSRSSRPVDVQRQMMNGARTRRRLPVGRRSCCCS